MENCHFVTRHRSLSCSFSNCSFSWAIQTSFFYLVIAAGYPTYVCKRSKARKKQITKAITVVSYSAHEWLVPSHLERKISLISGGILSWLSNNFPYVYVSSSVLAAILENMGPFVRHLFVYGRVVYKKRYLVPRKDPHTFLSFSIRENAFV
jgi:hypothetical protein